MILRRNIDSWAHALCVALAVVLAAPAAGAIEPSSGSKNFTAPRSAPDYFSNESEPFRRGATARAVPSEAAPAIAAPTSPRRVAVAARRHGRHHARSFGHARGRFRLARLHAVGRRHIVHSHAARIGKRPPHRVAHAPHGHERSKAMAAGARHRPAASKGGRRVAHSHG